MSGPAEETVVVRATAPGTGGIAVLEVWGPEAARVVGKYVRPGKAGQIVFGRIADEVLVRYLPGGRGVEISCHGGTEPAQAVVRALGLREVDRAFVLDRDVRARRLDRLRAEALTYLPGARTVRAARILADQAAGALSRAVLRMKDPGRLLATAPLGCALATPRQVSIVGRPNSGKSTLFNALVAQDRALVSPEAGTTRDPVSEVIDIKGVPVALSDTAGLGVPQDQLDRMAQDRTRRILAGAHLVLLVRDGPGRLEGIEQRVLDVRTKSDLGGVARGELAVCAPKNQGLDWLRRAILRALGLAGSSKAGAAMVFTERQRLILEQGGSRLQERLLWGN